MKDNYDSYDTIIPPLDKMIEPPPIEELNERLSRFIQLMNKSNPDWNTSIIFGKINQYYFTGTMQDGLLLINSKGKRFYFVRKSIERAKIESPIEEIYQINSYRDVASIYGKELGNTFFDTETATYAIIQRFSKHFNLNPPKSLDKVILSLRAVKSPYELHWMKISGKLHHRLLTQIVPDLIVEGISEAQFIAEIFRKMISIGYHGVSRFSMFETDMVIGQIGFGESSIYPTSFDGPGGNYGMSPAVPTMGRQNKLLCKGDLVFVDIAFGVNGYHSDKTQVYLYGAEPSEKIKKIHQNCIDIEKELAAKLIPGAIPAKIYNSVMSDIDNSFLKNFMGFEKETVKFLGHGVGLYVDEFPVIANGFNEPLKENMVVALEPKKGIQGFGMVGVEDTYIVTPKGGKCITGGGTSILTIA